MHRHLFLVRYDCIVCRSHCSGNINRSPCSLFGQYDQFALFGQYDLFVVRTVRIMRSVPGSHCSLFQLFVQLYLFVGASSANEGTGNAFVHPLGVKFIYLSNLIQLVIPVAVISNSI